MKQTTPPLLLILFVILLSLAGCAGSRAKSEPGLSEAPPPPAARSAETLLGTAGGASAPAASGGDEPGDEEARLLENDSLEDDSLLEDDADWTEDHSEAIYTVADPLEKFNRAMFVLNDKLYFWLMKPVARGYRAVVPTPARSGVKNFFYNVTAPVRIVNNILQGKGQAAEAEWARFLYNATVGVLGFRNPAGNIPKLNPDEEDLGQTLAVHGVGDGFFLMLPFLGPSTLRDTVGFVGDLYLNPLAYADTYEVSIGSGALNQLNNLSFRIGDYEALKNAALDPYEAFRNAYIQLRQSKIRQ